MHKDRVFDERGRHRRIDADKWVNQAQTRLESHIRNCIRCLRHETNREKNYCSDALVIKKQLEHAMRGQLLPESELRKAPKQSRSFPVQLIEPTPKRAVSLGFDTINGQRVQIIECSCGNRYNRTPKRGRLPQDCEDCRK